MTAPSTHHETAAAVASPAQPGDSDADGLPDDQPDDGVDDHGVLDLVTAIERERRAVPDLSVAALRRVLTGVITGEGPTTTGRIHFSRTLDPADAALCARILAGAGGAAGMPVTRREADLLFEIDAASAERTDGGRFADLFVKAVAHCALSQAGHRVPPRRVALDRNVTLSSWASRSTGLNRPVLAWIAEGVNHGRRSPATLADLSRFLSTVGATVRFMPASATLDLS